MNKTLLATISLLFWLTNAVAGTWSVNTLPMPYLQEATHHTCNPDNILSTQAVDSINKLLTHLQTEKGVQAIVVVVEHLEGDDPYAFNRDLFKKYGIGQKDKNNGLVITLATQDRSYQISPGEGLEKTLPDVVCSRIENRVMVPMLKDNNWDEAMTSTVNTIFGLLTGDEATQKAIGAFLSEDEEESSGRSLLNSILGTLLMPFVTIAGVIYALIWRSKRRKCPHCGKKLAQKRTSRKVTLVNDDAQNIVETWTCLKCGKTDLVDKLVPLSQDDDGGGSSSSHSSSSNSSHSSGGSFGGGSYGGGGAGGRF